MHLLADNKAQPRFVTTLWVEANMRRGSDTLFIARHEHVRVGSASASLPRTAIKSALLPLLYSALVIEVMLH